MDYRQGGEIQDNLQFPEITSGLPQRLALDSTAGMDKDFFGDLGRILIIRIDLKGSTRPINWCSRGQQLLNFVQAAAISQVRTPAGGRQIAVKPLSDHHRRGL